jgi:VanZ family protein
MSRIVRAAAMALLVLIAVLSLTPKEEMIRTVYEGHLEHVAAYAGATPIIIAGAAGIASPPLVLVGMAAYSGLMELGQFVSPGRTPKVSDWLASSLGALVGLGLHAAWTMLRRNARRGPAFGRAHGGRPGP